MLPGKPARHLADAGVYLLQVDEKLTPVFLLYRVPTDHDKNILEDFLKQHLEVRVHSSSSYEDGRIICTDNEGLILMTIACPIYIRWEKIEKIEPMD